MAAFLNVCRFNPTAGGTTDWTYSTAVTGYQSPALAGVVNGTVYKYRAESADLSQWELGEGAYNTGTGVLARTTVLYNSSGTGTGTGQSGAGTKITFSTVPQVAVVALKEDLVAVEEANAFTDAQKLQARTNIGAGAIATAVSVTPVWATLGTAPTLGNGTLTASIIRLGPTLLKVSIKLTFGSTTSAGTGGWYFTLPSPYNGLVTAFDGGASLYKESGVGDNHGTSFVQTGQNRIYQLYNLTLLGPTAPFTWGTGDTLETSIMMIGV